MVPSETTSTTAYESCMVCITSSFNKMATGMKEDKHWWKETAFYFISLSFLEKGVKPDLNYSVKVFGCSMRCRLYPPVSLFMVCKERYNICMDRGSFIVT